VEEGARDVLEYRDVGEDKYIGKGGRNTKDRDRDVGVDGDDPPSPSCLPFYLLPSFLLYL
jgi:hypothetical protein